MITNRTFAIATGKISALVVGTLFCCPGAVISQDPSCETEDQELYAWFDSLEIQDLERLKCVEVISGWVMDRQTNQPRQRKTIAFLLNETGETFQTFGLDFSQRTYEKTAEVDREKIGFVGYNVIDLESWSPSSEITGYNLGGGVARWAEIFVLARGIAARGNDALARQIMDGARRIHGDKDDNKETGFEQDLNDAISHNLMWNAITSFPKSEITRGDLLTKFNRIVDHFPDSQFAERAKEGADTLQRMIEEDELRARSEFKPLNQMSLQEQIAEHIYEIRNQSSRDWGLPPWPSTEYPDVLPNPLVVIGYDAVPQLIDAVDDQGFTRRLQFEMRAYRQDDLDDIVRVGFFATEIIEEIAGRSFFDRSPEKSKDKILQWWSDLQEKGEKQVLIEGTSKGDSSSHLQANRLAEKYPEVALEPIVAGAKKVKASWSRVSMIKSAGKLDDPAAIEFFLEEMISAPSLDIRVAAAVEAFNRGQETAAVDSMTDEFEQTQANEFWGGQELIEFLAKCRDPEAIEALASEFDELSVGTKESIVSAFGTRNSAFQHYNSDGRLKPNEPNDLSLELNHAIEDLLIHALSDTSSNRTDPYVTDGKIVEPERVCDVAGEVLRSRWPDEYRFDYKASIAERDEQSAQAISHWSEKQNRN